MNEDKINIEEQKVKEETTGQPPQAAKKRKIWPFIVIILIGLVILISPALGRILGYFEDRMLMNSPWSDEDTAQVSPEPDAADLEGLDDTFSSENQSNDTESENVEEEEEEDSVISVVTYKPTVIGSITIPKLNLTRPIANDVQKRDLRVAIGKIPGSSGIGQAGNVSLAGHRNYAYKEFFDNLDKMEIGDQIILKSNSGTYTYEVYDIFVTTPDDVSVMAINRDESICTLITCDPKYIATNRLIVKGRLVESE